MIPIFRIKKNRTDIIFSLVRAFCLQELLKGLFFLLDLVNYIFFDKNSDWYKKTQFKKTLFDDLLKLAASPFSLKLYLFFTRGWRGFCLLIINQRHILFSLCAYFYKHVSINCWHLLFIRSSFQSMSKSWDWAALVAYFSLATSSYLLLSKYFQPRKKRQDLPHPLVVGEDQLQLYNHMYSNDQQRVDLIRNLCSKRQSKMNKEKKILELLSKLPIQNDQSLIQIGVQICKRIVDDYQYSTKTNEQLSYIYSQYLNWDGETEAFIHLVLNCGEAPNKQVQDQEISNPIHLKWIHEEIQRQKYTHSSLKS